MYMKDFSYADKRLSDLGCVVAYINTSPSNSVPLGNKLQFETIKNMATNVQRIVKVDYEPPNIVTFDICKDPCNNIMVFDDTEISYLMRWLNKKSYEKFRPIYDDGSYPEIYFMGSFNITSAIYINSDIVGFTVEFTPNAPYGFETEKIVSSTLQENGTFEFYNNSDEYGYVYPSEFKITFSKDGNFEMSNSIDAGNTVKISNCISGETITMDCQNKIILTDSGSHSSISKDFNYNFPRFKSTEYENKNIFTVSIPCTISVTYSLIRKAGIIV